MECWKEGKQIVLNPYALCRMEEGAKIGELPETDRQLIKETYREQILAGDPFYNKNLSFEDYWRKK